MKNRGRRAWIGSKAWRSCRETEFFRRRTGAAFVASGGEQARACAHLAAPISFGITQLGPALADYLSRYPEVVVDATLDDRFIDLVEEGFDLALRVGSLKDTSLIARRLAPVRFALCASPGYQAAWCAAAAR